MDNDNADKKFDKVADVMIDLGLQEVWEQWQDVSVAEEYARSAYVNTARFVNIVKERAPDSIYESMALEAQLRCHAALQRTIAAVNKTDQAIAAVSVNEALAAYYTLNAVADRVSDWGM